MATREDSREVKTTTSDQARASPWGFAPFGAVDLPYEVTSAEECGKREAIVRRCTALLCRNSVDLHADVKESEDVEFLLDTMESARTAAEWLRYIADLMDKAQLRMKAVVSVGVLDHPEWAAIMLEHPEWRRLARVQVHPHIPESELNQHAPRPLDHQGVEVKVSWVDPYGCYRIKYTGTTEDLIAAGVATADMLVKGKKGRVDGDGEQYWIDRYYRSSRRSRGPDGSRAFKLGLFRLKRMETAVRLPGAAEAIQRWIEEQRQERLLNAL